MESETDTTLKTYQKTENWHRLKNRHRPSSTV